MKNNALNGKRVYLSQPIEFSKKVGHDWKIPVVNQLKQRFGLVIHDPAQDDKQKYAGELQEMLDANNFDAAELIAKRFVKKDLQMVQRSDFLILFNPCSVPSTGCPMEVMHAITLKLPVLIVVPDGKKYVSKWYLGCIKHQYIFGSWNDLYTYLEEVDAYKHTNNHRWWFVYGMV